MSGAGENVQLEEDDSIDPLAESPQDVAVFAGLWEPHYCTLATAHQCTTALGHTASSSTILATLEISQENGLVHISMNLSYQSAVSRFRYLVL